MQISFLWNVAPIGRSVQFLVVPLHSKSKVSVKINNIISSRRTYFRTYQGRCQRCLRSELQNLALFSAIAIALELENLSSEMLRIDIIGGGVGSTASGGTLAKVESYIWEREAALH